ncbi:MAG TPA: hypothetical protein DEO88_13230, partial [Syntrophobacteraceae bacterium]|nr:hypothetical protein [Syntrophobacteraceae bacterium]
VRLLPKIASANPRIVLIGITEDDIRNQGVWPLPDATLAESLSILLRAEPRAIGLDIYRDIPVPPGHAELESVLEKHRQIIAVTKFGSGGVS